MDSGAIQRMVDSISNTDIRWDGTFIGLTPTVVSDSARQVLAWGSRAAPQLVRALEDESRFVVAHVLLTLMSGAEHHAVPWNGLDLDLLPDGRVKVDARQRFELAQRWQRWLQASPPRTSVPE